MKSIATLVKSAGCDDRDAYEEIVRRHQGMAVGYAFAILADFQMAEDAAQEAFVDAYLKLNTLKEPKAFGSWLKKIVFKHCDRMTRGKKIATRPIEEGKVVRTTKAGPRERMENMELSEAVQKAVNSLPKGEREVTAMFYIEEQSHKNISGFLNLPVNTVKSRLHSARGKLKEKMMIMIEGELKRHKPGDEFARRVIKAIAVYTEKGPAESHMFSAWHDRLIGQVGELLKAGEEGFNVAVELSRHRSAKVRTKAALHFGLCRDPKGKKHLERMLKDPSAQVRHRALVSYAMVISPVEEDGWRFGVRDDGSRWASRVPKGIEKLFPLLDDDNVKLRLWCVLVLRPYARLEHAKIDKVLKKAIEDPKHKVQHSAALALGVACPGCGATEPTPAQSRSVSK